MKVLYLKDEETYANLKYFCEKDFPNYKYITIINNWIYGMTEQLFNKLFDEWIESGDTEGSQQPDAADFIEWDIETQELAILRIELLTYIDEYIKPRAKEAFGEDYTIDNFEQIIRYLYERRNI